ncbi:MAG: hypothetical protein IKE63_02670 [Bacilli bacterium]|nr:hypothetical protein [Bacilli bacterium]
MKTLKKIIFVVIVMFIVTSTFKFLKNEHKVNYKIKNYNVNEHFYTDDGYYYDFVIKDKKNMYVYTLEEKLNKSKKVITNIETYKSNNLICIIPKYKEETSINAYCNLDKIQVSVDYLQKTNNNDFKKIINKIKKYKIKLPSDNDTKKVYKQLKVYNKNIDSDHVHFIWNYKGIYVIKKDDISYKKIIDYDLYDNVMTTVVDKYYVLFENSSVNGIENVYYYNIDKDKVDSFKLEIKLSKNSYINGVVDNLIYVTDKRQKKEYAINIKDESITEVDNDQTSYIVYDNSLKKTLSKSDYFMQDNFFDNSYIVDKKVTSSKSLKKEYNYYYYVEDNKFYKVLESNKNHKILLFELDNITDWLIKDRELIVLKDDTIYLYTDQSGLKRVLSTNELRYNYENIYDLWKK